MKKYSVFAVAREAMRQHSGWEMLVGFDFSSGMAAQAARQARGLPVHVFVGDAQASGMVRREQRAPYVIEA